MLVHTHWPHVSDGPERKQTTTREAMRIYIYIYSLVQDRGSSTRLSQSSLPLHQRSIGKQRVPCPSLLGQRNSEMSHVFTSDGARKEAVTIDDHIAINSSSVAIVFNSAPSRKKKENEPRNVMDLLLFGRNQQTFLL